MKLSHLRIPVRIQNSSKYFFFSRHREIIQSGEEGQQSILANIRSTIETEKERCIAKEADLEVSNAQDRLQY